MHTFIFQMFINVIQIFMPQNNIIVNNIKTPDKKSFSVAVVTKMEADSMEILYKKNKIDDQFLETFKRYAYEIDNGRVLYRQFFESIGFVFPSLDDFKKAIRGNSFWDVSLQPTDDINSLIVKNKKFTRIVVSFSLMPVLANNFRNEIDRQIFEYENFEGYCFYELKDCSIVMLRRRTTALSDGYWFSSMLDFDFFYYVLSGKERPEVSM